MTTDDEMERALKLDGEKLQQLTGKDHGPWTLDEIDREIASKQTHCYTCGKPFGRVKYECPTCREWQCSEACRRRHIESMDRI